LGYGSYLRSSPFKKIPALGWRRADYTPNKSALVVKFKWELYINVNILCLTRIIIEHQGREYCGLAPITLPGEDKYTMKLLPLRFGMKLAIIPFILAILSCSFGFPSPVVVQPTVASQSTSIAITSSTNTPRPTFTPTEVNLPLTVAGCLLWDYCPGAVPVHIYFDNSEKREYNILYPVPVSYKDTIRFLYVWCAVDRSTLDENLAHMEYVFTIDGVSYLDYIDQGYTTFDDDINPYKYYPCYTMAAVLSGWKIGESHEVVVGAKFLEEISNGWKTSPAIDHLMIYNIIPSDIPPAPTITPTPSASDTPVPSCEVSGSIIVTNNTDGQLSISFQGQADFIYTLGTGMTQAFAVCPGVYFYEVYGCGDDYYSGTVLDGDTLSFACVSP
jgi:hypothetical protein